MMAGMALSEYHISFKELRQTVEKIHSLFRAKPFDISTNYGRSQERYRRVVLTAGGSFVNKAVTTLTGLITVPLTIHYLGTERYGLWMTISSTLAFLTFADFGLGNGLLNAISKANGLDNRTDAIKSVSSTFFMLLWISLLIFTFFCMIYPYVPWGHIFNVVSDIAIRESGPAMAILVISFLINLPLGIIEKIQRGYQEGYKNQFWLSAGAVLGLVGVLLAIYAEAGLPWLVLAITGGPLLASLMNGVFLFAFSKPWLVPRWRHFDLSEGKKLASAGLIFLSLQLFAVLGNSTDNIVIAQLLGSSAVAEYAITQKLFAIIFVSQYVIQPLWPAFGEAISRGDYIWAKKTLGRVLKLSMVIGMVAAFPLLIFGKQIIAYWVGPELIPDYSLLLGFYFWLLVHTYNGSISVFLNTGLLVAKQFVYFGAAAICVFLLKIFLAGIYGTSGVVWATLIGYGVFFIIPAYRLAFGTLNKLIDGK
ncbi:MAG: hypothetical protein CSYNP_03341 [Syntrophus sp. SKADARSKE-3]|nr:hypothetical protein [Syntrophus sp. SKADARSKE-3]